METSITAWLFQEIRARNLTWKSYEIIELLCRSKNTQHVQDMSKPSANLGYLMLLDYYFILFKQGYKK